MARKKKTKTTEHLVRAGLIVRGALKNRGLSQGEFERGADLSHGAMTRWLQGKVCPEVPNALKIERTLGVPVEVWVGEIPENLLPLLVA